MVKSTAFGTSLLISGPEDLLAERAVEARIALAHHEHPDAELHRVQALGLEGNSFAELAGCSLFATSTVLIVNDLAELSPDLFDVVLATAIEPAPDLALILVHNGGMKGNRLLDQLKKAGIETQRAATVKTWELPAFVLAEAGRQHLALTEKAGAALVAAVGSNLRALAAALTQLASDSDGEITEALIAKYFGGRAETTSFAVCDALLEGDTNKALETLRWALDTGVQHVLITSALAANLRSLGKFYDLRSSRMQNSEMARAVGVPAFKVKDLYRRAQRFTPHGVGVALRSVAEADAAIKGAESDPGFALERMVLAVDAALRAP